MPDSIIKDVLNGKLDTALLIKWLNDESIDDATDDCVLLCYTKSDFVAHFLTYLRNQTDSILQTNTNAAQILHNSTPDKLLARGKHRRSASEPHSEDRSDSLVVRSECKSNGSPNRDRRKTGRRVKTKLFGEERKTSVQSNSDESRLSLGIDRITLTSTPLKNGLKDLVPIQTSPVTPRGFNHDRCDTPRLSRYTRTEKSCLGDYLVTATAKSSKKKPKKNTSNDEIEKVDLDLSNSDIFPEIGARKASSLRYEKRRIKPTNIDKSQKSVSLNSFNAECFQQPQLGLEDNSAFKHQKIQPKELSNTFEAERSLLKQERHKLMEKFNILNTQPTKTVTPKIRVTQKESVEVTQNYIKADPSKVLMKEKIDSVVDIYNVLTTNNLILSINTELYFLISILVSKQVEEEYAITESKLMENNVDYLLKSIHNSTYFAVKSLWNQRAILEVILDKSSLKTLGENKKVRSYTPELAKFLLNAYSFRCEAPSKVARVSTTAVVNYNCETDNADNFPNNHAFHLFKKQRDMFYDIVRWYQSTSPSSSSRTTFRARVKALLSGSGAASLAHLASLCIAHMLAQCLPNDDQESKLSKLQRRLTCQTSNESNRLPRFNSNEIFYKEFITHAENESFRVHLKDALSSEIVNLDNSHLAVDDRGNNSNNLDISREYLQLSKKLALLAKFLGYLTSLPYSQVTEVTNKSNVTNNVLTYNKELYATPKEKVLENSIGLRNYSQPTLDIKGMLDNAIENHRLSITLPWIAIFLSMLDFTSLRLKYYNEIITKIYDIYRNKLKDTSIRKNTIVYLKSILGWLFDLPHFPLNSDAKEISVGVECIDSCDLVDESTILELCPCLRDVNNLLATCKMRQEKNDVGSFRHITPVSLSVSNEDRMRNKEKELQNRLEEELLKSQPSSTRRVVEMVVERVTSAAVKDMTSRELPRAAELARELARRKLATTSGDHSTLVQTTTMVYANAVRTFRSEVLAAYKAPLCGRAVAALTALLPNAAPQLHGVVAKKAFAALTAWVDDHTHNTTILCKDLEAETRTLLSMNEMNLTPAAEAGSNRSDITANDEVFNATHVSVAEPLIHLKEHICQLLDDQAPSSLQALLSVCAVSSSPNNMFNRTPSRRAFMQLTLDLALVYVSKRPEEVTDSFLNQLHSVWNTCCPDRKHHAPEEITFPERRDEISPELRNFEDDERMATPISDDEEPQMSNADGNQDAKPNVSTSHPNASTSQPSVSSSQPNIPTPQKWQPIKLQRITLQPINTKSRPGAAKSQPASPMYQPIVKFTTTSKSQPVSPKLQPAKPFSPKWQPISPKWQPISPKWQPISPKWQPITQKWHGPNESATSDIKSDETSDLLDCFDRILCPRNVVLLGVSRCDKAVVWEAMARLLVFLLRNDYLSEDSLTEQCLAVYRQDWTQNILENLSACMKSVSSKWARSSTGKFTLFLDFLAEYCGDMDYEPSELN